MTDRAAWAIRWCTGDRDDPEAVPWRRERPPDRKALRRRMWLYAEPIRCKRLIRVLRWCYHNRLELLMLALCVLALVGAEWAAKLLVRHI